MRFMRACFWPKNGAILQKIGGPTKTILHFFSRFSGCLGFFHLQAVASQGQAAIKTLQKKSCLKTYRRFFVRPAMCHNRPMNGKVVQWEMGREKPAAQSQARKRRLEKPGFNRPPAAIQPLPVAVSTSQYK
jgi:hypothetical protein